MNRQSLVGLNRGQPLLPTAAMPSTLPCHNMHSDNEVAAAAVLMYEPS